MSRVDLTLIVKYQYYYFHSCMLLILDILFILLVDLSINTILALFIVYSIEDQTVKVLGMK